MQVLRRTALLIALGLVIGLSSAAALTRLLGDLLYRVHPLDVGVLLAVAAVLLSAALTSGLLAARRATSADPLTLLRVG